jgi:hypothetical protein
MAHKLLLSTPAHGMPYIWNIDQKVGTQVTEQNLIDDVSLVQLLLKMFVSHGAWKKIAPGCLNAPIVTGQMDNLTGF